MKKVFVISALALIAVGTMVSCKKKDDVNNGCTCTYYDPYYGTEETRNFDKEDMQYLGISSCSAFAAWLREDGVSSVSCK